MEATPKAHQGRTFDQDQTHSSSIPNMKAAHDMMDVGGD
jgi:hypothetical protein